MAETPYYDSPALQARIYALYREFFDMAEKRRRWSLTRDIPWDQCNPNINPAIADVVESFCAVELYLPDYLGKSLPTLRASRGRSWFVANWGYEESKHSLALGDWLLRSGLRSEEQMADLEKEVVEHEWNLPSDNIRGVVCYSMTQELATWLNYRNLRLLLGKEGDPALHKLLGFISTDERAHHDFFRKLVKMHLEEDRPGTLEQLRRVLNGFGMPAIAKLADSRRRIAAVQELHIFDDSIFYTDVMTPILESLGVSRAELRRRNLVQVSKPVPATDKTQPDRPPAIPAEPLAQGTTPLAGNPS